MKNKQDESKINREQSGNHTVWSILASILETQMVTIPITIVLSFKRQSFAAISSENTAKFNFRSILSLFLASVLHQQFINFVTSISLATKQLVFTSGATRWTAFGRCDAIWNSNFELVEILSGFFIGKHTPGQRKGLEKDCGCRKCCEFWEAFTKIWALKKCNHVSEGSRSV